jgi:hypothetical protein
MQLLLSQQTSSAKQIPRMLVSQGITSTVVSVPTLLRGAKRAAKRQGLELRAVRGSPRKGLTQATIAQRLEFCRENKNTNWRRVMFTDRKKFLFKYPGTKVAPVRWQLRGQKEEVFTPNHPQAVNVYAAITIYGVSECHVVAGTSKHKTTFTNKKGTMAKNITTQEYHEVLTKTVLPEGTRIFANNGQSTWTLQQDNDPSHKAAGGVIKAWNTQHNSSVQLLRNWPPNSPDLNPIENLWAVVQRDIDAFGCKTFAEFQETVKSKVRTHGNRMARALVDSMANRVKACIEANGCKTKY